MTVYEQLEAAVLPIMTHFQTDVTKHDRNAIESNPGVPFLHWVCDMHTHIQFLIPSEEYPKEGERVPYLFGHADRWHILREKTVMAGHFTKLCNSPERYTVHYFDGSKLKEITVKKAWEIATEYQRRIEFKWYNEMKGAR